jgi:hypothetical protein
MFIQTPGLNIITEYAMGLIYPGRPIANVCFKTYGYMSMAQAVSFLSDFKLGHYMKIPPRSMFLVQVLSSFLPSTDQKNENRFTHLFKAKRLITEKVKNIKALFSLLFLFLFSKQNP